MNHTSFGLNMVAWKTYTSWSYIWRCSWSRKLTPSRTTFQSSDLRRKKPLNRMHFEWTNDIRMSTPTTSSPSGTPYATGSSLSLRRANSKFTHSNLESNTTLGNGLYICKRQRSPHMQLLFNIINLFLPNNVNFILKANEHASRLFTKSRQNALTQMSFRQLTKTGTNNF